MRPLNFIIILLLTAALAAVYPAVVFLQGPKVDGKRLVDWLPDLQSADASKRLDSERAIKKLGADAVPILVRRLHPLEHLWLHVTKKGVLKDIERRKNQQVLAAMGLRVLGPLAEPAIPELTAQLSSSVGGGAAIARTLAAIQPKSYFMFVTQLKKLPAGEREVCYYGIAQFNTPEANRLLAEGMRTTNSLAQVTIVEAINESDREADDKVKILMACDAESQDSIAHFRVMYSLAPLALRSPKATKAIGNFANHPDPAISRAAQELLQELSKAGR